MSGLVVPHAFPAAEYADYAKMQTLTDAITQLQGGTPTIGTPLDLFSAVQVNAQTGIAVSTYVALTFDTTSEIIDVANGHSTTVNNSRYTPKNAGIVEVGGNGTFAGSASGIRRVVEVRLNGVAVPGSSSTSPNITSTQSVPLQQGIYVSVNGTTDYLEIWAFADYASWATGISGAAASRFTVKYVHA
jgi:hypothetical protein